MSRSEKFKKKGYVMPEHVLYTVPFSPPGWMECLFLGLLIVMPYYTIRLPKDFPLTRVSVTVLSLLLIYFSLLGGKILYIVLQNAAFSKAPPIESGEGFADHGLAYLGSIIGQILCVVGVCKIRKNRISALAVADYIFPYMMLIQVFVRMGCFFNECCYGKPTDLPWGVVFSTVSAEPRHPTQIYSMIFLAVIFVLLRMLYKKKPPAGVVFFSTFALYGFFRFFVEFLRVDSILVYKGLTLAQTVLASMFFVCLISAAVLVLKAKEQK